MKRLAKEQSRLLRRQLTMQTLLALAIFTAAFAAFAFVANSNLVPWVSEEIADATAEKKRFDPEAYISKNSLSELLESYKEVMQERGYDLEVLWLDENDDAAMDPQGNVATAGDITGAALGQEVIDAPTTDMQAADSGKAVDLDKAIVGEVLLFPNGSKMSEAGEGALEQHVEQLTWRKLGFFAAWRDYLDLQKTGNWDFWYEGSSGIDSYSPFVARNLTTYDRIKTLKMPAAISLYLIGCLIIVLWQMRRSLRYFDELAGAVAGIISDRSRPVALSPRLSVTQSELNRIRVESLADEYAAKAAEQRKNELVAYLAHDIRTPLTSILGYLSLMDESPDLPDDARQRFTHTALVKAERLEGLIDEFFEITRYNLQAIPIERSMVSVRLFMDQIADEFFPTAFEKQVAIDVHTECSDDATFFVDGEKLARAVENVLRNAVAYADAGTTVILSVAPVINTDSKSDGSVQESADGFVDKIKGTHAKGHFDGKQCGWHISITNQGREISPEHLESIFEKFYREDSARNANSGGAGLGLAIAREIITAHGGSIAASSAEGITVFDIVI